MGANKEEPYCIVLFFLNVVGKRWKSYHLMQNVSSPQRMCCWVRKGVVSESKGCGFPIAV